MSIKMLLVFKFVLYLNLLVDLIYMEIVPKIPCPEYFEYVFVKDHFEGKITLRNAPWKKINLEIELSQQSPLRYGYQGFIALNRSEVEILNGKPIIYQVVFPTTDEVPKLIKIKLNEKIICSGFEYYSFDSHKITLHHSFVLNSPLAEETKSTSSKGSASSKIIFPSEEKPQPTVIIVSPNKDGENILSLLNLTQRLSKTESRNDIPEIVPRSQGFFDAPTPRSNIASSKATSKTATNRQGLCGRQTIEFTPFVYGGTEVNRGQMPWIAAIYHKKQANLEFLCSGSLVSTLAVITAAHCLVNQQKFSADRLVVYVGRHNLADYSEKGYEAREIKTYIIHPEYKIRNVSDADVAILIFEIPINFSDFILPVCLWDPTFSSRVQHNGKLGYIAGWGADEDGRPLTSIPKMVAAKIYSNEECLTFGGYKQVATSRTLCAGNVNGTGPCLGDSGAGLIVKYNERWYLRALVSGGLKTENSCDRQKYVVYCDLAKHTNWISRNLLY